MGIMRGERERASKFKIGQKVNACVGGGREQRHLPNLGVKGVISEIKEYWDATEFSIRTECGKEFKPFYANQLTSESTDYKKTFCGEPIGYGDPPCSEEYGQCNACEIKNLKCRIQELVGAIREHKAKFDEGAFDFARFVEHVTKANCVLHSVLTEDKQVKHCWEGGTKETCDCPDCGRSLIEINE